MWPAVWHTDRHLPLNRGARLCQQQVLAARKWGGNFKRVRSGGRAAGGAAIIAAHCTMFGRQANTRKMHAGQLMVPVCRCICASEGMYPRYVIDTGRLIASAHREQWQAEADCYEAHRKNRAVQLAPPARAVIKQAPNGVNEELTVCARVSAWLVWETRTMRYHHQPILGCDDTIEVDRSHVEKKRI